MALCSVVFSPFSPFSAGSHPLELAPPPPPCSRETNLHFHLHTTLQRTIRTWMSIVTARAERMSRMTDDQYLRSRAWKPLYKTPFPGHWFVSIKKVDNLWKRRWMIFAFKETILSRFVTIKEVVSVSKKPISYPSRKLYKEDMKLSKLNGTSQSILINFFVTMDRPAG